MATTISRIDNTEAYDVDVASLIGTHVVKFSIDPQTRYILAFQLIEKATGDLVSTASSEPTLSLGTVKHEGLIADLMGKRRSR